MSETIYDGLTQPRPCRAPSERPRGGDPRTRAEPAAGHRLLRAPTAPEFHLLARWTGQPDFVHLMIDYVPGDWLVESKSLKLFLGSFQSRRVPRGLHDLHRAPAGRDAGPALAAHRRLLVSRAAASRSTCSWQTGAAPEGVWIPIRACRPTAAAAEAGQGPETRRGGPAGRPCSPMGQTQTFPDSGLPHQLGHQRIRGGFDPRFEFRHEIQVIQMPFDRRKELDHGKARLAQQPMARPEPRHSPPPERRAASSR